MRSPLSVRGAALVAATAMIGLTVTAAPATASAEKPQAKASSVALTVNVSDKVKVDTGRYTATYNGKKTVNSGTNKPALPLLGSDQKLLSVGVFAQDAAAALQDGTAYSGACSALAGKGATLVAIGDGSSCVKPGEAVTVNLAELDLQKLGATTDYLLTDQSKSVHVKLGPVNDLVQAIVSGVLAKVGKLSVGVDLDAAESTCMAQGSSFTGKTQLKNAAVTVNVPGKGDIKLADLPANPKKNTTVVPDLSPVTDAVLGRVDTLLKSGLENKFTPDDMGISIRIDLIEHIKEQLAVLLKGLETDLVKLTMNKQEKTAKSLEVSALDIKVLDAVKKVGAPTAADVAIGTSTCGTNGLTVSEEKAVATGEKKKNIDVVVSGDKSDPDTSLAVKPDNAPANAELDLLSSPAAKGGFAAGALALLVAAAAATRWFLLRRAQA
ncbi:hypothetical protein [Nocardioides albus]|uniref:Uncharacterized protein n=1 Tax=Nocardioides albus TaxID=1841 RepID=A0A7W5A0L4_9ACTN|nr:hypothetical protein [Nocardioides albus]MBB3087291.1 hypothetical protein [Nocardioides albus]GGU07923.1 hypothetical protein GCM10007979_02120 [Nocardioides albus]